MAEYYKYEKYQKYINGVPADPPEYKQGELIGTGEYDSKADCEKDSLYRWVDNGKTVCKGYSLYNQEKKQKSTDKGVTWTDTGEVRDGNRLIDQYSKKCGWRLMTRWQKTGKTVCQGYVLSEEYIKQESQDMGKTWNNSVPEEYKYEVIDSYNEDCILNSEPLTYEVTSESVDLSLEMGLISISMKNKTSPPYDMGYKEVTYKFWIQWDEEESIVPYNITTRISGVDSGSSYTWRYNAASNYRVPGHQYLENKTHTIKVWGMAVVIGTPNVPFKILKWGTAHGVYFNDPVRVGWGGHPQFNKYVDYYSYHARRINLSGDNLLQWAMVENNALYYNDKFVSNNTQMDHLPVTTFQGMQTTYLDVSNNSKLLSIPTLQEGEDNKVPWKRLLAKNCTSLTETPSGIWQNKTYNNSIGETNWDSYASFDCTDAFNGCTNLTKINGPIKVDIATRMFMNTGLQNISNVDLVIKEADSMFEGLSTLTTLPKSLESYEETEEYVIVAGHPNVGSFAPSRERMFYGTGITEATEYIMLDPTRLYAYSHSGYTPGGTYTSMFENSSIAKVSGILPEINLSRFNYNRMFANTQVSEISSYFSNITQLPSMNQMFFNCKLTQIPNDFINKDTVDVDVNRFQEVFANNFSLTNYPIQDNIAIWYWTGFYPSASLISTYAFLNCHSIEDQVPLQWGGFMSDIKPVIIETEGTSITVDAIGTIKGPDGSIYTGKTTFPLQEGVNTIRIWTSNRWKISGSTYKIIDFGSNGVISSESNKDLITYLGTDQGAFKATTKFPISKLGNVERVSVDFLKSGTNINSLDYLFEGNTKLTSIPDGTFSKLANLSGADYMLRNSNIQRVDGLFEGCANLISVTSAFKDCESLISAQRTFKDCTKLSNIDSVFGNSPEYKTLAVNCNQLFENTGVDILTMRGLKLSSAIGMFRNNSKLTTIYTEFTLVGDNVDVTEMFKDCPLLNNTNKTLVFVIDTNSTIVDFTRCWQNCTSLSQIPEVWDGQHYLSPWNVPNAIGTQCFNGCTALLQQYGDQIPDGWK